ncbi:MAG: hypothetical protein DHS20C11_07550 [Lysobacteraceae bacterium]|nr:MAG: hypothetical protein DHS20C11_07550 [Xanthomonadaceae bacterium]
MRSMPLPPFVGKMASLKPLRLCSAVGGLLFAFVVSAGDDTFTIELEAIADNSLFQEGDLSNGGGEHTFVGRIASGALRRALIKFDVSTIPGNAVVESAELTLNMSRTISGTLNIGAHRLLNSWGEGTADAPGQEGGGAPAQTGDATWLHRHFPTELWSTEGGDFVDQASATSPVFMTLGQYQWSGSGMVADINSWRSTPSSNHGWILVSSESPTLGTAKRFDSREITDQANAPRLVLTLSLPPARAIPTTSASAQLALAIGLLLLAAFWFRHYRRLH